ncbi:MAG: hypothetical protein ACE5JU_15930 [Candidatus Binatia bacterium]
MRRGIGLLPLFLFFCCFPTAWAEETDVEWKNPILSKILNPLPDYDPFDEHTPSSPQFFPDEVDKRLHQTLIDSLSDAEGTLEEHVRYFKEKDAELLKERGAVTGLTEHVLDLYHNTIRDREGYLTAQKKALASASSEQQKKIVQSRIRNDEVTQADRLLKEGKANKWGAFINRLLGSVDLVSILSGSYVGAAVDTTVSQLLAAGSAEMSIEERKALALYLEYLKRYPEDPKRKEILKVVEALKKKKQRILVQRHIEQAEEAMSKGELTRAELHYDMAALIDPTSSVPKDGIKRLRERIRVEGEERRRRASLLDEHPSRDRSSAEDRDLRNLLYALALRDSEEIEAQAMVMAEKYQGKPLGESARDALAVALEIKGQHEEAKEMLQRVARSSTSPRQRKRAKALLESPEYNLLASLQEARTQRRLQTIKYVLLGEDFLEKNLLLGASPLITQGLAGASSLGTANLLIVGTNLLQVLASRPISYQPIIDRGVAYIRSHPESESATDVYRVLAEAYENVGAYDKAIAYFKISGKASEEKIADLKDKAAKALLQAAGKSKENSVKERYLKAILEYYPESGASREATRKLAHLLKIENRGLRISKKFLMENPELYGVEGLGLKATLFDGKTSNMELAGKGVNLLSESEILLHFQTPWGVQSRTYQIKRETVERFELALRKKHYKMAAADVHTRAKGSPGGIRNLPPRFFRGKRDRKTPGSESTDLKLVKKATGPPPTFPKVLDYELLSENEKTSSSKFKLPPIHGSVSASGFDISGSFPTALWGDRVTLGADEKSPFAGLQLPIPLLQDFIPVDFLLQGRPGRPSLTPQIHQYPEKESEDAYLYR